jgi:hypothetical protein
MSKDTVSTRRSFLKSGAILAAPLGAVASAAVIADDGLKARVARLEDEAAIRSLHQTWVRKVNSIDARNATAGETAIELHGSQSRAFDQSDQGDQAVRSIAADHAGEPDAIDIAADGRTAAGRFPCVVEIESEIAQDCTLAEMAHAQGSGFVRRTERRILRVEYVKDSGAWAVAKIEIAPV